MRLLKTNETKWDKKIQLELSLRELQIIRDAMGATNYETRRKIWDKIFTSEDCPYNSEQDCPYNSEQGASLFSDINYILKNQGGVIING